MPPSDAYTGTSINTACGTNKVEVVPEDKTANTTELRQRIDSFNIQPKARSPSFVDGSKKSDDIPRAGSVSDARRPSFIKGQEDVRLCNFFGLLLVHITLTIKSLYCICNRYHMICKLLM